MSIFKHCLQGRLMSCTSRMHPQMLPLLRSYRARVTYCVQDWSMVRFVYATTNLEPSLPDYCTGTLSICVRGLDQPYIYWLLMTGKLLHRFWSVLLGIHSPFCQDRMFIQDVWLANLLIPGLFKFTTLLKPSSYLLPFQNLVQRIPVQTPRSPLTLHLGVCVCVFVTLTQPLCGQGWVIMCSPLHLWARWAVGSRRTALQADMVYTNSHTHL